ncbi:MAG: phosphatase PAP2 family protein, partial [bacterium]|nr:phosphatase PAP2 family protein [bacterium]
FVGAGLMGVARVFVGVHYPLDILVGAAIGFIIPFLIKWVLSFRHPDVLPRHPDASEGSNPGL